MNQYDVDQQKHSPVRAKVHCPECHSRRLSPFVDTTTEKQYAIHTRMSKNWGVSEYGGDKVQRSYWICNDCGERFRNIRDLQREIENKKGSFKFAKFFKKLVPFALAFFIFILIAGWQFLLLTFIPIMSVSGCLILVYFIANKEIKDYESLIQELSYLKKHCIES